MNTADDGTPAPNRQPVDPDLGPEPDWLIDDEPAEVDAAPEMTETAPTPVLPPPAREEPVVTAAYAPVAEPIARQEPVAQPAPAQPRRPMQPWMLAVIPFLALIALAGIAWYGTTQTFNNVTTWNAIRGDGSPLLPARWTMQLWWLVVPLLGVFLIYAAMPFGRGTTRIKLTGWLLTIAFAGTGLWVFAQHWNWQVTGLLGIGIATLALLGSYLLVALGPAITKVRQRVLTVIPLSIALGYGAMLTVVTWQGYSSQPFGARGSSVLIVLLLTMLAAVFAFFLRDGLFGLVLAVWFAGVVHQQWGEDALISLIATVALLLCAALAVMGTLLSLESARPSLTAQVGAGRTRTSFFNRSQKPAPEELP